MFKKLKRNITKFCAEYALQTTEQVDSSIFQGKFRFKFYNFCNF